MRYPVCKECGSDRVWSDAVAFYDDTTQGWDIADANEVHFGCNECDYDDVSECIATARVTVTTARWADYPRPSLEACAQATVAACGVLRMWADAPVMREVGT